MAAALASREMRRAAAFLWMMPLDAALSSVRTAAWTVCLAAGGSPWAMASRAFFTADLRPVRTCTFLVRRFWDCRLRFSAERIFANVTLRNRGGESGAKYRPARVESSVHEGRQDICVGSSPRLTPMELLRAFARLALGPYGRAEHSSLRSMWRNDARGVCAAEPHATRVYGTLLATLIHCSQVHPTLRGTRCARCESSRDERIVSA